LWIRNLAGWTGASKHFGQLARAGRFRLRSRSTVFSTISIPSEYTHFEKSLSRNARHHLRRNTHRIIEKIGAEILECRSPEMLEEMLPGLFTLHQNRWQRAGQRGTFFSPEVRRFYWQLSRELLAKDKLGFYGLKTENELRALWYGIIHQGTYCSMSLGFDTEFENIYHTGVANVLFGQIVQRLIARGIHNFDHLGGFSAYKARWGAEVRYGTDALLCNRSFRGNILHRTRIWPTGRYVRETYPTVC